MSPSGPTAPRQVTHEGHRLYTFTLDSSGEATGEGFSDTFGGQRFTWHAAVVDSASSDGSATTQTPEHGWRHLRRPRRLNTPTNSRAGRVRRRGWPGEHQTTARATHAERHRCIAITRWIGCRRP